jgi:hypothetical protein
MERKNRREKKTIMHKSTDYPNELHDSFPLSTQRFLERPRGEGGDAKRRGVRIRESDHILAVRALDLELRAMLQRAVAKEEASAYMEIKSTHDHLFSVGMRALTAVPMDIEVTAVKALLKRCEDKDVVAFFARHKMQDRVHLISEKLEDLDRGLRESNTAPPASPDSKETSEARKQLDTSVRKFRRYLLDRFESDDTAGITFQKGFLDILQRATAKEEPPAKKENPAPTNP